EFDRSRRPPGVAPRARCSAADAHAPSAQALSCLWTRTRTPGGPSCRASLDGRIAAHMPTGSIPEKTAAPIRKGRPRYPPPSQAGSQRAHLPDERIPTCFRSEEHTSELQSRENLVCRLLLEKKNT